MSPLPAEARIVSCLRSTASTSAEVCATFLKPRSPQVGDDLRQRQLATIWRLVEDYQRAAAGPLPLGDLIARVVKELSDARDILLFWVDAIESIVQEVEDLYGPAPSLGMYKAAQVKAAVVYMVEQSDGQLRSSTLTAVEKSLEEVVGFIVDGTVLILNRRNLWDLSPGSELRISLWFRLRTRLALMLLALLGIVDRWMMGWSRMLPAVRLIADKAIREKGGNLLMSLRAQLDFVLWSIEHRRQLLALLDLVSTAAVEAEAFVQMSGSEKQRYARELVLLVIQEEFEGWPDTPAWNQLTGALIDLAIDSTVRIFNKRNFFETRSNVRQAPNPVAAANPA
jgi:hypothetical protein